MQFYISNENLDRQISRIRQQIRLSMNGVTADSMKEKGVVYKQNFGVAIPVLREIAKDFSPSHDLAERLWIIGGRETMILSALLQPIDGFTPEKAIERVKSAPQKEIIDVLCLYLLSKTAFATALSLQLIQAESTNEQSAGFILAARVSATFSQTEIDTIIGFCRSKSETDDYRLYSSIALCLARFCRLNSDTAALIRQIVENFPEAASPSQRHIANDVKLELDFFE